MTIRTGKNVSSERRVTQKRFSLFRIGHVEGLPFFVGELGAGLGDGLHGGGHVVVALGLLGELGALDLLLLVGHGELRSDG